MSDSPYIFNVGKQNFDQVVIQGSRDRPVLVDFWASWCAPCQALIPLLGGLAEDYHGAFHLAKVNTEENQDLAMEYGIRSIPAVKLFKNGEIVDEFAGALPEAEIRAFLDKHIERESEGIARRAKDRLAKGDVEQALELARQALAMDPMHPKVVASAAHTLATAGDTQSARDAIEKLPPLNQEEAEVRSVLTELELREARDNLPDADDLRQRLDAAPDDSEARFQLAQRLAADGHAEEALEQLLTLMREDKNWNDGAARKMMLKLFDTLGDDPLVARYRGRIANLLH